MAPEDLEECLSLKPASMGAELVGDTHAIEAWKKLVRGRSLHSAIIKTSSIGGQRIVSFGCTAFVSRAFADEEISHPQPGLNARIIASIHAGRPVILSDAELRAANTKGGLDVVILYSCWNDKGLSVQDISEVQWLMMTSFFELHRGYRLNRLMAEADEAQRKVLIESSKGWRVISDFEEFYRLHSNTTWPFGLSLVVITSDDALAAPGSTAAQLFQRNEPILQLRDIDQQLLNAALRGSSDEELARALRIQLSSVKKRWRSLFTRISAVQPNLLPNDGLDGVRGREKRRSILAYVRTHPEELRPTSAPDSSKM